MQKNAYTMAMKSLASNLMTQGEASALITGALLMGTGREERDNMIGAWQQP